MLRAVTGGCSDSSDSNNNNNTLSSTQDRTVFLLNYVDPPNKWPHEEKDFSHLYVWSAW